VKSKNENTVIKDHEGILSQWAKHLSELLNCINSTDPAFVDHIPQFPMTPQALHKIQSAVKVLKYSKAAGSDSLPEKVFKYGGHYLT